MTHTLFNLAGHTTLVLCKTHRDDAVMWLWHEFEGKWTATVTGHAQCDACAHRAQLPASFRAALHRQATPPRSMPGRPLAIPAGPPPTPSAI